MTELNKQRNPKLSINGQHSPKTADTRKIMTKHLGRPLLKTEEVHHINGNRSDNRVENLAVLDRKKHRKMHVQMAEIKMKGGSGDE